MAFSSTVTNIELMLTPIDVILCEMFAHKNQLNRERVSEISTQCKNVSIRFDRQFGDAPFSSGRKMRKFAD